MDDLEVPLFLETSILRHTSWDFEQYCDDRWANIGSFSRIDQTVKGLAMPKIAMEGMDVVDVGIHPRSLTWPLKNHGWNARFLWGWYIFRGYVKLPGSKTFFLGGGRG